MRRLRTSLTARVRATSLARRDADSGAVTIIVALLGTVFLLLAALVVDRGLAEDNRRQAQNAADASALAAAGVLAGVGGTPGDAGRAARDYAQANFGVTDADWAGCTDPGALGQMLDDSPCLTYDPGAFKVRVTIPTRTVPAPFSSVAGVGARLVAGGATAAYAATATPDAGCVLCVLGQLDGQVGQIVASGGDVYARDIQFNPSPNGRITVTGGRVTYSGSQTNGTFSPSPAQQVAAVPDPFGSIPQPPIDPNRVAVTGSGACSPAEYYVSISGCTSFAPGIYVLVGSNPHNANVSASDVMFFLTCSTTSGGFHPAVTAHTCAGGGEAGANFGGAGNTDVTVTGLQSDPIYRGFALWVDRNNTTGQRWTGNASFTVVGNSYSANPAGLDSTRGNGLMTVIDGTMVIGALDMRGNHLHLDVTGTGAGGGPPPLPAPPHLVR